MKKAVSLLLALALSLGLAEGILLFSSLFSPFSSHGCAVRSDIL